MNALHYIRQSSRIQKLIVAGIFGVVGVTTLLLTHAASSSVTYKGQLTSKSPQQSYSVIMPAGQLDASLSFTAGQTLQLDVINSQGAIVATKANASNFTLSAQLPAGTYQIRVTSAARLSGKVVSYTLLLTYPQPDTTPPTVGIASPAASTTVSGTVTITGTANDNVAVAKVEISVDSGTWQPASGTTNWSYSWNTTNLANGGHSIRAQATDSSGNVSASASLTLNVNNVTTCSNSGTSNGGNVIISNCTATNELENILYGSSAEHGTVTVTAYWEEYASREWLYFRDSATGNYNNLEVTDNNPGGWSGVHIIWAASNQIWLEGQSSAGVIVRGYQVNGTGVPTSLSRVDLETFGNSDSRQGSILALKSGGIIAQWHQQGQIGPQALWLAYRDPTGAWHTPQSVAAQTASSKQTIAQHPSDGSIWLFNDPDAWGAIGVVHISETASGINIDWSNNTFIQYNSPLVGGVYIGQPDPENPDIEAQPDLAHNTIVLAYESAKRQMFGNTSGTYGQTWVTGSYPVIASISANQTMTFVQLPIYVERISIISLVVNNGNFWLGYHPIDNNNGSYSFFRLQVSKYTNGTWATPNDLGSMDCSTSCLTLGTWSPQSSTPDRPEFFAKMSDKKLHFITTP